MAVSKSLTAASRIMAWLSMAGFVIVPAITVYAFLDPLRSGWLMLDVEHMGAGLTAAVPEAQRVCALCFALIPVGFDMWALWSLGRLFRFYARDEVFSLGALRALNHVALALFWGVLAGVLAQAPISYILSFHNGPHHREISLGIGSGDIAWLFIAGTVLVIARVMGEARRVADENAAFV